MPFIPKDERRILAAGAAPTTPGQMCYLEYVKLMEAWKKEPRWTTAHNLFKQAFNKTDAQAARMLAYMVFFLWEIENYELDKEITNGPIE